jgi:hypothetical protein
MERLEVPRGSLPLEDFWAIPPGAARVNLTSAIDGSAPRLKTEAALYHDGRMLYVLFRADDDEVFATHLEHDAPLWEEDVVEVFLAPLQLETYYEIEVNPLGTTFDAIVRSPDRTRATMDVDRAWECTGLWTAIRRDTRGKGEETHISTLIAIPFSAIGSGGSGSKWRANLYRIDRSSRGDSYSAWCPTLRDPADFHVPDRFGELLFL